MKKVILLFLFFSISIHLTAQGRINLDTLNIEQLNLYLDKAVKERNAGMITTFTGIGIYAAGVITSIIWTNAPWDSWVHSKSQLPYRIGRSICIPATIVGVFFWSIGGIKKFKAEIAILEFNIKHENSNALGLGITFRF